MKVNLSGAFQWDSGPNPTANMKVLVDPQDFKDYCSTIKRYYLDVTRSHGIMSRSLILSYESIVEKMQEVVDHKISKFLDIDSRPVRTQLRKQSVTSLEDSIENISEVRDLLNGPTATLDLEVDLRT